MNDPQKRIDAAQGYLMLGMARQAIDELNCISHGRDRNWHALQAEARAMQCEHAAAVEHYRSALSTDPRDVSLCVGLARSLQQMGHMAAGLAALEAAYQAHPDEPELLYQFARLHAQTGEKVLALSWLGRAIRNSQEYRERAVSDPGFQQFCADPAFELLVGRPVERTPG